MGEWPIPTPISYVPGVECTWLTVEVCNIATYCRGMKTAASLLLNFLHWCHLSHSPVYLLAETEEGMF